MKPTALALLLCLPSAAAFSDGNELLAGCQVFITTLENGRTPSPSDAFTAGHCAGLVQGVSQVGQELPADMRSCSPDGMPVSQGARVLIKWLKANPEILNRDETALTVAAFNQTYPCKDSK
jgi:hypothetical protein